MHKQFCWFWSLKLIVFVSVADLCSVYSSPRCSTSRSVLPSEEEQEDLGLHLRLDNRVSIDVVCASCFDQSDFLFLCARVYLFIYLFSLSLISCVGLHWGKKWIYYYYFFLLSLSRHRVWSNRWFWCLCIWSHKQHRWSLWRNTEQTWYADKYDLMFENFVLDHLF